MAEIQDKSSSESTGKKRAKKMNNHLDMTPMVDLAFLLLTFFMLTTSFSKANTLKLQTPLKAGTETPVKPENALTILLGEQDKVYHYFGLNSEAEKPELVQTDFSENSIRKLLHSPAVKGNEKMVVMLKPMEKSRYRNVVDLLDELKIANTKKYALVSITDQDKELIIMHESK